MKTLKRKGAVLPALSVILLISLLFTALNTGPARAGYVRWVEYGGNPVYDPADPARAYYPCVIYDADQFSGHGDAYYYKMWFGDTTAAQYEKVTYSNDGINWTGTTDTSGIAAVGYHAKVVYDAGGFGGGSYYYKMWYWDSTPAVLYSINAIRTADSVDGVNWENDAPLTQDATHTLIDSTGSDWNRGSYGPIEVLYNPAAGNTGTNPFDYSYAMYYDGTTGGLQVTGLAYSSDGIGWTRYHQPPYEDAPVLDRGGIGEWDSDYSSMGAVVRESAGVWHYWYSGGGPASGGNQGIGYASSPDGIDWTRDANNPLLYYTDGPLWRNTRTYTPSVVYSPTRFDGHGAGSIPDAVFKMWYTGRSSAGSYAIGYAERSSVITVGPSGRDFTTIQAAVNGAYDGDTILVDPGTYNEMLVVDKQLTVQSTSGAASTIIDAPDGEPYVVMLRNSNIVFDGFTVTNPGYTGASDASGIVLTESTAYGNVYIGNCVVHNIGTMDRSPVTYGTVGINLGQCHDVEVDNCEVYNIGNGDTSANNWWAQGISIWGMNSTDVASNINVHDCYIHDVASPGTRDSGIGIQGNVSGSITWRPYLAAPFSGTPPATPIQVTTASPLPDGSTGIPVSIDFSASGGAPPYAWFTYHGTLPPGLTLSAGGTLSGSPTAAGDYAFDIEASDGTQADFKPFTMHISAIETTLAKSSDPPGDVVRGQVLTYTLRAGNDGSANATGCVLTDAVPAYADYVSHSTTLNGVLIPDASGTTPLEAGLAVNSPGEPAGVIAPGEEAAVTFRVQVAADLPLDGYVRNTGTLTSTGQPPVEASVQNDSAGLPATWYFAEGSTQAGFDEFILLANMGDSDMDVTVTYLTEAGVEKQFVHRVPAHSRRTVVAGAEMPGETGLSAIVEGRQGLICERTLYFDHAGINGGHQAIGANATSLDMFFAEGYTGGDGNPFEEWILVLNPNTAPADLKVTYLFPGGATKEDTYTVAGRSRLSISVDGAVGEGREVSTRIISENGVEVVAERAMYFDYHGEWGGGHIGKAVTGPRFDWYLAEGFTGSDISPFDEYILVSNNNDAENDFTVTFMFPDGSTQDFDYTAQAQSRFTVVVDSTIGEDRMNSARVVAEKPVVVERAMYFDYNLQLKGGHNSAGATSPASEMYFAEGYTGNADSQFQTWLLVQNTDAAPKTVVVDYVLGSGEVITREMVLPGNSRTTVNANQEVGGGSSVEFSMHVRSKDGSACLVAERAMYFDFLGSFGRALGGDDVLGY